ncbi:myb-like DNA-binding protein bas1 [Coemansia sp. Benny D115]|nr:myb-like DNA-binding protein bas1 [Coemansia sp. Benny D115]
MGEAQLRSMVLSFVRQRKTTACSPTSPKPSPDALSNIHPCSPRSPSSLTSTSSLTTLIAGHAAHTSAEQARKRHRSDSDVSSSQQRIGIDLLLNASTLSDQMDCYKSPMSSPTTYHHQLPSPPTFAKNPLSPIQSSPVPNAAEWNIPQNYNHNHHRHRHHTDDDDDGFRPQALPPISQLAQGLCDESAIGRRNTHTPPAPPTHVHANGQPLSAPAEGSFGTGSVGVSSLEAYRIGSGSSNSNARHPTTGSGPAYAYQHIPSFPPPISATRSQPGIALQPSPPESHYSSPNSIVPAKNSQCVPTSGISPVPSSALTVLPPTGDSVVVSDFRRRPLSGSPPAMEPPAQLKFGQQANGSSSFSFDCSPHRGDTPPPHLPHIQHHNHQLPHQPSLPQHHHHHHQYHQLPPPPPLPLPSSQPMQPLNIITVHGSSLGAGASGVSMITPATMPPGKNVSKPKFNYAFLDTKRPRGPSARWSAEEDALLKQAVRDYGEDRQWVKVAQQVPGRTNLQCRQRWLCNIKAQVEKEKGISGN